MKTDELFQQITDRIVTELEACEPGTWSRPWKLIAGMDTPMSVLGRPYRGINALWLPLVAQDKGWMTGVWGTYNQWQKAGCQVQKASIVGHGTHVIIWKESKTPDPVTGRKRVFASNYTVFAPEQTDLGMALVNARREALPVRDPIMECEAFFADVGATVHYGGNRAFYSRVTDSIQVPLIDQFDSAEHFYSTMAHEHIHWTGAPERLDREKGAQFGDDVYGFEELIAELGAAFLSAHLGFELHTHHDHVSYLSSWLRNLKAEPSLLRKAAGKAQRAVDYLVDCATPEETEDDDVRCDDAHAVGVGG